VQTRENSFAKVNLHDTNNPLPGFADQIAIVIGLNLEVSLFNVRLVNLIVHLDLILISQKIQKQPRHHCSSVM